MTQSESAVHKTRPVKVGSTTVGGGAPVVVQSMCATKTMDIEATVAQVHQLARAGAGIVRIALDNEKEVSALKEIRAQTRGVNLSVDLQENYRIADKVAPHVDKLRYNPGHLHHIEKSKSIPDKVRWLAAVARDHDLAIRIGVNCGSVAPAFLEKYAGDQMAAMVESAVWHCEMMDSYGFDRFVVSLKDSDPARVLEGNRRFAARRPDVPLHLGVTGATIRVSLTLPNERKHEEVEVGFQILRDVAAGRFISVPDFGRGMNIISCPSCSRVENEKFVELAQAVKQMSVYAAAHRITIAVMGCRVNGPGETDDADLGLWCGPTTVNLKKKDTKLGNFPYDKVIARLRIELDKLISERSATN
jgi:(E)-4-hydroxy-3-methylbut-2-enyl-diphosphate synthase